MKIIKELLKEFLVIIIGVAIVYIPFCYGLYYSTNPKSIFRILYIIDAVIVFRAVDEWVGGKIDA